MQLRRGTRVVELPGGGLRIGVDPGVVIHQPSGEESTAVARLGLGARLTVTAPLRHLHETLAGAGLLQGPPADRGTATIRDCGPLGQLMAVTLAQAGWSLRLVDERAAAGVMPGHLGPQPSSLQGRALAAVTAAVPGAAVGIGEGAADVEVLPSDGALDLHHAQLCMASDTPHLPMVATEAGFWIGPLVIPGRGPCLTCVELAARPHDPTWPLQRLQLSGTRQKAVTGPVAARAVAAGLAVQALESWRHGREEPWMRHRWQIPELGPIVAHEVEAHPACGCAAAGEIGDELAARRASWRHHATA